MNALIWLISIICGVLAFGFITRPKSDKSEGRPQSNHAGERLTKIKQEHQKDVGEIPTHNLSNAKINRIGG